MILLVSKDKFVNDITVEARVGNPLKATKLETESAALGMGTESTQYLTGARWVGRTGQPSCLAIISRSTIA